MNEKKKIRIHGLGASNHTDYIRADNDYYSTDPSAITLLDKYDLLDKDKPYWETACGNGKLVDELNRLGYNVSKSTDLIYRGCGTGGVDFFKEDTIFKGNTITNPPYKNINDWILHSLKVTEGKVYIFARIQLLESQRRYDLIFKDNPPRYVCPFVKRINCYRDDNEEFKKKASTICYAWFIWDKEYTGDTTVKWLI